MIRLRIKYKKYGPIRFIGHLDVMRYFQKVIRRAGVDIAYSEGYSPHQLMSFALPLTVGATSDAEYADLTLNSFADLRLSSEANEAQLAEADEETHLASLLERLDAVCREGITVTDAHLLAEGATKAMTAVSACAWRCALRPEAGAHSLVKGDVREAVSAFLSRTEIPAVKRTKKGERTINLRPLIYDMNVTKDGEYTMLLKAGSEDNLKPALALGTLLRGEELSPDALILHRLETYQTISENDALYLAPLIDTDPAKRIAIS